jgi:hypothetical protein
MWTVGRCGIGEDKHAAAKYEAFEKAWEALKVLQEKGWEGR